MPSPICETAPSIDAPSPSSITVDVTGTELVRHHLLVGRSPCRDFPEGEAIAGHLDHGKPIVADGEDVIP